MAEAVIRQVLSQMTKNQFGNLASDSTGARGTIEIVERRTDKIVSTIDSIINSDFFISARRLASFSGQIISTKKKNYVLLFLQSRFPGISLGSRRGTVLCQL